MDILAQIVARFASAKTALPTEEQAAELLGIGRWAVRWLGDRDVFPFIHCG